jgi:hypothetical protein
MPNNNPNLQRTAAFYHSLGKVQTESSNLVGNEKYKSAHNVRSNEIWTDEIAHSPTFNDASSISDDIVVSQLGTESSQLYLFPLSLSNYQTWFLDTGTPTVASDGFIPSDSWSRNLINPSDVTDPNGNPSDGFKFRMFRNDGTPISYNNSFYDVDYFSGLIRFQEGSTPIDTLQSSGLGFSFDKSTFESTDDNLKIDYIRNSTTGGVRAIAFQYVGERLSDIGLTLISGLEDSNFSISDNATASFSGDSTLSVSGFSNFSISDNATASFSGNSTLLVSGFSNFSISDNATASFSDNATASFSGDSISLVSGFSNFSMPDNATASFSGDSTLSVSGNATASFSDNATASFSGDSILLVSGFSNFSMPDNATASFSGDSTLSVSGNATASFSQGSSFSLKGISEVDMADNTVISMVGSGSINMADSGSINMEGGGSINMGGGSINMAGGSINMAGGSTVDLTQDIINISYFGRSLRLDDNSLQITNQATGYITLKDNTSDSSILGIDLRGGINTIRMNGTSSIEITDGGILSTTGSSIITMSSNGLSYSNLIYDSENNYLGFSGAVSSVLSTAPNYFALAVDSNGVLHSNISNGNSIWTRYLTVDDATPPEYVSVPTTSTSLGVQGQRASDNDFIYECISTDNWVRYDIDQTF